MSDKTLYLNIETGKLLSQTGAQLLAKPVISYQAQPTWEIHFVNIDAEEGTFIEVDHSDGVAWKVAVDTDFDVETVPMMRTLDEGIDHSKIASGILLVDLDAYTETFLAKVNGKSNGVTSIFEIRGSDVNGKVIYDYRFPITCIGSIDPDGTEPLPVVTATVTQEWVLGNLRAAPEYQFSLDGITWHETREHSDLYYQTRYPEGEWSESILLVNGVDGYSPTLSIGSITTLEPGEEVSIVNVGTPDEAIWDIAIPSGRAGKDGYLVAVGTTTTGEAGTNAFVEGVLGEIDGQNCITLNFTIPRGGVLSDEERAKLLPDANISGQIAMWDGDMWKSVELDYSGSLPDTILTIDDIGITVAGLNNGYIYADQLPTIPSSKLPYIDSSLLNEIPISKINDLQYQLNTKRLISDSYSKVEIDNRFNEISTDVFVTKEDYNLEITSINTSIANVNTALDAKLDKTTVYVQQGSLHDYVTVDRNYGDLQSFTLANDYVVALSETYFYNFSVGDCVMIKLYKPFSEGSVTYKDEIIIEDGTTGNFIIGIICISEGSYLITAPTQAL